MHFSDGLCSSKTKSRWLKWGWDPYCNLTVKQWNRQWSYSSKGKYGNPNWRHSIVSLCFVACFLSCWLDSDALVRSAQQTRWLQRRVADWFTARLWSLHLVALSPYPLHLSRNVTFSLTCLPRPAMLFSWLPFQGTSQSLSHSDFTHPSWQSLPRPVRTSRASGFPTIYGLASCGSVGCPEGGLKSLVNHESQRPPACVACFVDVTGVPPSRKSPL